MQVLCSPNALPEMVKAGRIKAFAGFGANLLIWPDPAEYQEAVRNLDFSFATDYFYRDETHHDMDLVLPAAMNYERYAPFGVHGRKVSARKPVKPLGECWEDWKIALTIGAAVTGDSDRFFGGDPVKACDSMLNDWGTSYAERQAMLPNVNVCEWFLRRKKKSLRRDCCDLTTNRASGRRRAKLSFSRAFRLSTVSRVSPFMLSRPNRRRIIRSSSLTVRAARILRIQKPEAISRICSNWNPNPSSICIPRMLRPRSQGR